jgi:hypothetical protein
MKNIVQAALVAGAIAAAGLGFAGNAHASTGTHGDMDDHSASAYLLELQDLGIAGTAFQAREMAVTICGERAEGVPEDTLIDGLKERHVIGGVPVTYTVAVGVVMGAEFHFCSDYEEA